MDRRNHTSSSWKAALPTFIVLNAYSRIVDTNNTTPSNISTPQVTNNYAIKLKKIQIIAHYLPVTGKKAGGGWRTIWG